MDSVNLKLINDLLIPSILTAKLKQAPTGDWPCLVDTGYSIGSPAAAGFCRAAPFVTQDKTACRTRRFRSDEEKRNNLNKLDIYHGCLLARARWVSPNVRLALNVSGALRPHMHHNYGLLIIAYD